MILKIDHRDIRVIATTAKNLSKHYGQFHPDRGTIEVTAALKPDEQAEVLLHEIVHAVWCSRGMPKRATEEQVATWLAPGLATVFRDNPGLGDVLDNALNHGVPIVGASII